MHYEHGYGVHCAVQGRERGEVEQHGGCGLSLGTLLVFLLGLGLGLGLALGLRC